MLSDERNMSCRCSAGEARRKRSWSKISLSSQALLEITTGEDSDSFSRGSANRVASIARPSEIQGQLPGCGQRRSQPEQRPVILLDGSTIEQVAQTLEGGLDRLASNRCCLDLLWVKASVVPEPAPLDMPGAVEEPVVGSACDDASRLVSWRLHGMRLSEDPFTCETLALFALPRKVEVLKSLRLQPFSQPML